MSALPKVIRYCSQHPDEPVIRVSLNSQSSKLFYCHECLDELDKDAQSKLVKFHDFVETLHKKLAEGQIPEADGSVSDDVSAHAVTKEEYTGKLHGFISNHKQTVEEEFKTLEIEALEVLKLSKEHVHSYLDGIKESFKKEFDEYIEKSGLLPKEKGASEAKITKEELEKDIMKEESIEETEKKVRDILRKAQEKEDVKSGKMEKVLVAKKEGLEKVLRVLENSGIIQTKEENNKYQEKLEVLNSYLEALVFGVEDDTEIQEKNLNKKDKQVLSKMKRSLNDLQNTLAEQKIEIAERVKKLFSGAQTEGNQCSLIANGVEPVEDLAYYCETCFGEIEETSEIGASSEIQAQVLVCEVCKNNCHADHTVISMDKIKFTCRCPIVSTCCQFGKTCALKHTKNSEFKTLIYHLEGNPGSVNLCHFCATVCHKDSSTIKSGLESAECNCSENFTFCRLNQQE